MTRRELILSLLGAGAAGAVASAVGVEASCAAADWAAPAGRVWVSAWEIEVLAPSPLFRAGWSYVFQETPRWWGLERVQMSRSEFAQLIQKWLERTSPAGQQAARS